MIDENSVRRNIQPLCLAAYVASHGCLLYVLRADCAYNMFSSSKLDENIVVIFLIMFSSNKRVR